MSSGIGFCRNEVCVWSLSEVGDMVSDRGLGAETGKSYIFCLKLL